MYQHDLDPSKTLFIDDNEMNIEAASKLGLRTYLLIKPELIRDIIKDGVLRSDLEIR